MLGSSVKGKKTKVENVEINNQMIFVVLWNINEGCHYFVKIVSTRICVNEFTQ